MKNIMKSGDQMCDVCLQGGHAVTEMRSPKMRDFFGVFPLKMKKNKSNCKTCLFFSFVGIHSPRYWYGGERSH